MPSFRLIGRIIEDDEPLNLGGCDETNAGASRLPGKNGYPTYSDDQPRCILTWHKQKPLTLHPGHEGPYPRRGEEGSPLRLGLDMDGGGRGRGNRTWY